MKMSETDKNVALFLAIPLSLVYAKPVELVAEAVYLALKDIKQQSPYDISIEDLEKAISSYILDGKVFQEEK